MRRLAAFSAWLLMAIPGAPVTPSHARAQDGMQTIELGWALRPGSPVRVHNMVGSVRVVAWDRDSVSVRITMPASARFFGGGSPLGVKMGLETPSERDAPSAKFELRVPASSRVWIKSATASIDVSGITGGLDAYAVSGDIHITASPHEMTAESMDGNVTIVGSSAFLRAKSAAGDLVLRGGGEDVVISTVSGKLEVHGEAASAFERLRLESVTGAITFAGKVQRGGSLEVDSHAGNVEIALPGNAGVDADVVTIAGTILNRISRERPTPGRYGRGAELVASFDGGGARLAIRTFKGSVTLRHY